MFLRFANQKIVLSTRRVLFRALCALIAFQMAMFSVITTAWAVSPPVINPITVTAGLDKTANEVGDVYYTNDTRPTIAATFNQGTNPVDGINTAVLRLNGVAIPGSMVNRNDSGISYLPTSDLAANTYTVTVDVKDNIGTPAVRVSQTMVVDLTVPAAPVLTAPAEIISNDDTPEIAGIAEADIEVNIYDNALFLDTVTADSLGNFVLTSSALTGGSHTLTAAAVDNAGNESPVSNAIDYIVDTTVPLVDAGADQIANVPTLQDATASDLSGIDSYAWSQISGPEDGTAMFSATDIEDPTISADVNGAYVLRLTVTDIAGNSGFDEINFTWNSSLPAVIINAVASPSNNTSPIITGSAASDYSNIASVEYKLDDADWTTATAADGSFDSLNENYTIALPILGKGSHIIAVRATDDLGNVAASDFTSRTFVIDITPPIIDSHENISTGATSADGAVVTYTAPQATDNFDDPAAADCLPASGSTFAIGDTTVTCTKTDSAGNPAEPVIFTVTVTDNQPPVFDEGSQSPVGTIDNSRPTICGTFTDAGSGINNDSLDLTIDGWYSIPLSEIDIDNGHFCYTPDYAFEDGAINVTATIADNQSHISDPFAWDFTISSAPIITAVTPSQISSNTTSVTVEGTVPADDQGIQTVEIFYDGLAFSTPVTAFLLAGITDFAATIDGTAMGELTATQGDHVLTAQRTGFSGNMSGTGNEYPIFVDTVAPTAPAVALDSPINSLNQNSVSLTINGDPGLTAAYSVDDDSNPATDPLAGTVVLDGSGEASVDLDVSSLDDGTLTASATLDDEAGNTSEPGSVTALKDTSAPTLTVDLVSDHSGDDTVANVGDIVTLSMTASENITLPIVTIAGHDVLVNGSDDSYTATYTLASDDTEGSIAYQISGFGDENGNPGADVNGTSPVIFDQTAPEIVAVNPEIATNDDMVPISVTWSDSGAGFAADPTRTFSLGFGDLPTTWNDVSGTMTFTPEDPFDSGTYTVTATIEDRAGNPATTTWSFTIDSIAPTGTIQINSGALYANSTEVTLNLSATDNIALSQMAFSGDDTVYSPWEDYAATKLISLTSGDGLKTMYVKYKDAAGNESDTYGDSITLDTVAPAVSAGGYDFSNIPIVHSSATASDATSDIASYAWEQVSGPADGTVNFSDATVLNPTISADVYGVYVLRLTVTDNAGNTSSDNTQLFWDTATPNITIDPIISPSNNAASTITGTASDDYSYVDAVEYRIDGGGWIAANPADGSFDSSTETYTLTTSVLADGNHTIEIKAIDSLGNETTSAFVSQEFTVDTAPPAVDITAPLTGVTVNGLAVISFDTDETVNTQCSINNTDWSDCVSGITTLSDVIGFDALADGNFPLYLNAADLAGNNSTDQEVDIIKDTSEPNITVISLTTDNLSTTVSKVGDTVTAVFSVGEDLITDPTVTFGGQAMIGSLDSGQYTYTRVLDGTETEGAAVLEISATDLIGNTGTDSASTLPTDFTAPVTSDDAPAGWTNGDVTVTLTANETAETYYSIDENPFLLYTEPSPITFSINGVYEIQYYSIDLAGNVEETIEITVQVDKTDPGQPGSVVANGGDLITNNREIATTWSAATDAMSGIGHYLLRVRVGTGGSTLAIPEINTGNITEYTLTAEQAAGLAEGIYTFGVRAVDLAGNIGSTNYYSEAIIIDLTAPVIATHEDITAIEATSAAGATVNYVAPETTDNVDAPAPADCLPISGSTFPLGDTTVTCTKTDAAGNSATPVTFTVTVEDTTPPAIPVINEIVGTQDDSVDLSGTAEADSTVNLTLTNGATVNDSAIADSFGNWAKTVDITSLNDGTVAVTVTATDASDNTSGETSITFNKDSNAPVFNDIVANPANARTITTINITFTASETLSGNPDVTIDDNAAAHVSDDGLNYTYSYTVGPADTEGVKMISISGTDLAGNLGTNTGSVTFDFSGPTIDSGLADGAENAKRPVVQATVIDTLSGVNAGTVVMRINGVAVAAVYNAATGIISFASSRDMATRTYVVTIDAKDNAGNSALRYSFTFTITP